MMRAGAYTIRACLQFPAERVAVENPIPHGHAVEIIGRPQDQIVQPWWFGDKKMKATGWWLNNLPPLEKTNDVGPPPRNGDPEYAEWAEVHYASPGADRGKVRSKFYLGMAEALTQWAVTGQPLTKRQGAVGLDAFGETSNPYDLGERL